MEKIVVIGAGLCGSLMSLRLAQKGYKVEVFEKRPDMRKVSMVAGRSINLALSNRGLKSLDMVGLKEKALELAIPMRGRMIHNKDKSVSFVPYSGRQGEAIHSISRGGLNKLLLENAEKTGSVKFRFETDCTEVNLSKGKIKLHHLKEHAFTDFDANIILGTDGAYSAVRQSMMRQSNTLRFDFSQQYLDAGYKELSIPGGELGEFKLEKNALHIWPREGFMLIALPNLDGSFTLTLFLPFTGEISFEALNSDEKIWNFFHENFPTALEHMPALIEDYHANPTSALVTVKCFPWQSNGSMAMMGDAAHAIVPFYGQGMNASFEDCYVLDQCMDKYGKDWTAVFQSYQSERKANADAIADLAIDNFYEMRAATADPVFTLKRKIELQLEQLYPDYFSKYSMVTFREDIPYKEAMIKGRWQDNILMKFAASLQFPDSEELKNIYESLKKEVLTL